MVKVSLDMSVPLGKYWRRSPLVFSLVPRCHGDFGVTEVDVDTGINGELGVLGHFSALIPRQVTARDVRVTVGRLW